MKTTNPLLLFCIFLFSFVSLSCSRDEEMTTPIDATAAFKGSFKSSAHTTAGNVTVNKERTQLHFTDFKTDSGPNLDIYLVSNLSNVNSDYISLGDIKGINGNYTYDVQTGVDFTKYKYVVVWCRDFNVNFGYATLAP